MMTAQEYQSTLGRLGLDIVSAAELLGVNVRTSRRWNAGERQVPGPVAQFLRYLLVTGQTGTRALELLRGGDGWP